MALKRLHVRRPDLDRLDQRCLLSAAPAGLSPAQVQAAYGVTNTNGGKGETIALIEAYHNPNLTLELSKFDSQFGLSTPTLTQVNLGSSGNTNSGWAEEEALDVEWAHAIAPGANLIVVEAKSASTTDLMTAVQTAVKDGANVVSMSWGGSEPSNETSLDATFATAKVTFVASSGDTAGGGAEWPASSPFVVGVGGTTLKITTSGSTTTTTESAWDNSSGGSSGGTSAIEAEPSFQESVQSSGKRSVPDVAFDADPNSGVAVFFISPTASASTLASSNPGTWLVVGGTSLGAPAWAGIIADLDQTVVSTGGTNLGSTQTLQSLYNLQHDTPGDFNVVTPTTTTSGAEFGFGGRFTGAQSTTDDYVGLGTPKAGSKFLSDLTGEAKATEAGTASKDGSGEKGTTATTPTATFDGIAPPVSKTGGGTTTGSGHGGTGTTTGGGTMPGGPGGGFGFGPGSGFGFGPGGFGFGGFGFGFGGFGFFSQTYGGASTPVGTTTGAGPSTPAPISGPSRGPTSGAPAVAPAPPAPLAPAPDGGYGSNPFGTTDVAATVGTLGAFGLLAPVLTPNLVALVPLQNVPGLIDEAHESLDSDRFSIG